MTTIHVFPNPYALLDAKGRLAGACPKVEPVRVGGGMPACEFVGAKRTMLAGTYNANEAEGRAEGGPLGAKGEILFTFDVVEPIALTVDASQTAYYVCRNRSADAFTCVDPKSVPVERLARARSAAIAGHVAAYGSEPDTKGWPAQFPLDETIAGLAKTLDEREKAIAQAKLDDGSAAIKAAREKAIAQAKLDATKAAEPPKAEPPKPEAVKITRPSATKEQ